MDMGIVFGVFCLSFGSGVGMLSMSSPEFLYARLGFVFAAIVLGVGCLYFLSIEDRPLGWNIFISISTGLAIFFVTPQMLILTRNKEVFENLKDKAPLIETIERYNKRIDVNGDLHIKLLGQILEKWNQLKQAASIREQFTGRINLSERLAIDSHIQETLSALLGNVEARATSQGNALIIKTGHNTFRTLNPVPMARAPSITFQNLPQGVTANVIENSPLGFTVIFTPPSITIDRMPNALVSAEL